MGRINQAFVQERLYGGAERVPMIGLVTITALGLMIDLDITFLEFMIAGAFLGWGIWVLRSCAAHDPRLFQNLWVKFVEFVGFWAVRPTSHFGRWSLPATPGYMLKRPSVLLASSVRSRGVENVDG
jgi:hypothetical protein